ncbi:MAG: carboxypeptidase regulatory-like domain-containing protein [Chloroflexi bacterium]|nr:carboxypeptidase regulatory-like domain-containing protein [Chloroflexota bacterium]
MSRHQIVPGHAASVARRADAGHTAGLDAWLDADESQPSEAAAFTTARSAADWSAPSQPVLLAYDTGDSGLHTAVRESGVRPLVQEGSRRLMFEADEYEILLRVATNRQTQVYDLAGQVLYAGLPLPGARVHLDVHGPSAATATDGAGGFRLPPLMHGAYALRIAVDGAVLTTPPIALG